MQLQRSLRSMPLLQFSSLQSDSGTPWTGAHQVSLSFTSFHNLLKLMSTELVMPSNHLVLCRPLLLLPSIFHSIRVFPNESALCIRWPKYWSFSFSIGRSREYSGDFSRGPVAKTLSSQWRGPKFNPWSGSKFSHAATKT